MINKIGMKKIKIKFRQGLAGLLILSAGVLLWSENVTPAALKPDLPENARLQSALTDSVKTTKTYIDSLFYAADSIAYNYQTDQIYLYGNTSVRYQTSKILADSIQVDLKQKRAFSMGRTVLLDKDQVLIGKQIYYDVDSQTGLVFDAASKIENGYYYGGEVRKIDTDIYDVDGCRFTTCEDPQPDFWFWAKQMRLYRDDKVVGKPVVAYVNHLPVFYFPFITFSIKRGRQMGFLIPEPGYNTVDGKFIRNIDFFFPYKDYADATLGFDIMEKTGWQVNLETRYAKRYFFNGNFNTSFRKDIKDYSTSYYYSILGNHHHELGEKATLDANINYLSSKQLWNNSTDINEALAQNVTSSVSFRKPILSSYLNVAASYTQDLINNTVRLNLPSASFSLPTRPVYELFTKKTATQVKTNWWTNFNYSYNVRLDHTGYSSVKHKTFTDLLWDNSSDSTGYNEHHIGIKQTAGLNYNYKAFGWLNLTQAVNYDEVWMDRDNEDKKWVRGNDYNASTSANFTLYGLRNIPNFYVSTVRHIVTPSASFIYSPDFSDNDRFYYFGGIGLMSGKESRYVNLALDQKWQVKLKATEKLQERKLDDLLSWTVRSGIDLEKDDHKLSNLVHSLTFRPGAWNTKQFKLTYNSSFNLTQDPYQTHWLNWKPTNQYFQHTLNLSGTAKYKDYFSRPHIDTFAPYLPPSDTLSAAPSSAQTASAEDNWSISITQDMRAQANLLHSQSSNLRLNASVKVTTNWMLSYSNYYNIKDTKMLSQSFDISRNLHCWKLSISYTVRPGYWDYRIVLFNTSLPDALRFQTRDNRRTY
ncbi:MAG TPA: putative LPS assembly protein LptD [Candidatus Cloacimonadota bacterium]|nr:putative LPS assembly protein LptD [Candidatus Cloacimonadota bacterium]